MNKLYLFILISLTFVTLLSCEKEALLSEDCSYYATVEDHTDLDGCGYLFKLDNGEYLVPVWRWGFCGTPPLPKEVTEDPLWNYNYTNGERVRIGFTYANGSSICMKGNTAYITCIESLEEGGLGDR